MESATWFNCDDGPGHNAFIARDGSRVVDIHAEVMTYMVGAKGHGNLKEGGVKENN